MDPANFFVHLTFYQQIPESEKERGGQITREFELEEFSVDGVVLMGRVGTASQGEWCVVREFPFAPSPGGRGLG
jgi:hypothetical protein